MKIDLSKVAYDNNIDEVITIDPSYYQNTSIRSLSPIEVTGNIVDNHDETYSLNLNLKGEMVLPCNISLEDVNYPFEIKVDEIIDINSEENDEYLKIIDNSLDIMPIVWQNIVVEIPLRIVSPDLDITKFKGEGWELLNEEVKNDKIDPRLEKLKDLLDD